MKNTLTTTKFLIVCLFLLQQIQVSRALKLPDQVPTTNAAQSQNILSEFDLLATGGGGSSAAGSEEDKGVIRFEKERKIEEQRHPHNNSFQIKVCNSHMFQYVKSDGKMRRVKKLEKEEVNDQTGETYKWTDISASGGKFTGEEVMPSEAEPSSIEEIEEQIFNVIHKVTNEELKNADVLKEAVKGCNLLKAEIKKIQKVGTDGAGRDSDMMTAENSQWKYCLKNYGENLTTPGHLAKDLVTKGGFNEEKLFKNYQTIYYHAIDTRLKKFSEVIDKVEGKSFNADEINDIVYQAAKKLQKEHKSICQNNYTTMDSGDYYIKEGETSVYAIFNQEYFDNILIDMFEKFKEQGRSRNGLESQEARDELAICTKSKESEKFWKEVLQEANSFVSRCAALIILTTRQRDYTNTNTFNKPDSGHKSSQGDLECKDIGAQAQDYDWCLSQVIAYETMLAEEKISQTKFNNDIQQLKASELATQDPNDPTAALKSQVKVLQKTKEQFEYKVAAQGIKAGVLTGMAVLHGTVGSNVLTECKETYRKSINSQGTANLFESQFTKTFSNHKDIIKAFNEFAPTGTFGAVKTNTADLACERAMLDVEALPNQTMVLKAGALAVKMGADAAAFGLSIGQIDEAISKLNKLITEIENAVDGQIPENPFADLKQNPCLLDPTIEGCFEAGVGTNFGAGAGNVNIDGPEFGLSGAESVNEKKLDENNATGDKAGSKGDINKAKVAGVLNNTSRAKGVQDRVGAARIKTNPGAGGGGGGGGGGASAPGVGGGGGGRGRGGGGGGSNYQRKDYKLRTGGKGSTRAIFSGGQGIGGPGGKKARRDKNPFAKLAKGKSVDKFRNPAAIGKKGNSIWDTITNRYTDIDKKGRLEKYESR